MSSNTWLAKLVDVRVKLAASPLPFIRSLHHGSMRIELFAPKSEDAQQPHQQDELYIITRGAGWFIKAGESVRCQAGDVLFVEAGIPHHFEDFTPDFETWVIFWGPEGGEPA